MKVFSLVEVHPEEVLIELTDGVELVSISFFLHLLGFDTHLGVLEGFNCIRNTHLSIPLQLPKRKVAVIIISNVLLDLVHQEGVFHPNQALNSVLG